MNLSSRDLRAVIALIEERNFTRAAERVHLSQPAFSALIQGVEHCLGARLFERSTRSVLLTPEGLLFESAARRVLADFDDMVEDFRALAERRRGRVAIAALPSLAAGWLPAVLAEYRSLWPGVELALRDALSQQCLAALRAGEVDLALAASGDADADLEAVELCTDDFHLVCRADHPLAQVRRLRLADLAQHPFVHLSRHSSVRQHLEVAFHPLAMNTVLEVDHLATVMGLVAAGLGISVVPALTLFHFERPGLVVRPLPALRLQRRLVIVRRKSTPLSVAAKALQELLYKRRPQLEHRAGGEL